MERQHYGAANVEAELLAEARGELGEAGKMGSMALAAMMAGKKKGKGKGKDKGKDKGKKKSPYPEEREELEMELQRLESTTSPFPKIREARIADIKAEIEKLNE